MRHVQLSALSLLFVFVASEALAVVGRPLTPVSYAGVARRTTRRAAYAGAAAATTPAVVGTAAVTAAAVGTAAAVATLPAGCVQVVNAGVVYQKCGTTYYRPAYDGPNLVYIPTPM
ncbi:MAG TPA: hypothetical protein VNA24_06645 [Hyalangium sp.]|nr:hypothetical protein [Hyalangium sp.]